MDSGDYLIQSSLTNILVFLGDTIVKNLPASAGDTRIEGVILGLGRSLEEGNGNQVQYSCPENPMDRGAWWATVHRDFPGKNTGVDCHFLLQGIFPTQELNLHLLLGRLILNH